MTTEGEMGGAGNIILSDGDDGVLNFDQADMDLHFMGGGFGRSCCGGKCCPTPMVPCKLTGSGPGIWEMLNNTERKSSATRFIGGGG